VSFILFTEKISLVLLALLFAVQCLARTRVRRAVLWFWVSALAGIFGTLGYWTYLQYALWSAGGLGKLSLPPYQPISYFFRYAAERFFAPWGIALLAALGVIAVTRWMNCRYEERFFEPEEPMLIGLCFFLSGYPTLLFYLPLMFVLGILLSLLYAVFRRGRAPLYYWWVPLAFFAILLKSYVLPISLLNFFII